MRRVVMQGQMVESKLQFITEQGAVQERARSCQRTAEGRARQSMVQVLTCDAPPATGGRMGKRTCRGVAVQLSCRAPEVLVLGVISSAGRSATVLARLVSCLLSAS